MSLPNPQQNFSLHLHNIQIGAHAGSNGSTRLAKPDRRNVARSRAFSLHGFKRICQADDHSVMVTKRVLLRHRIARNSMSSSVFPDTEDRYAAHGRSL
jgi:hypothetical protein